MDIQNLIGKYLLIGVTFVDPNGIEVGHSQTHGKIISADSYQGITIEKADGSGKYTVPPDMNGFYPAEPGEYRLKTTGEIVVNPDFTSEWTLNVKQYAKSRS